MLIRKADYFSASSNFVEEFKFYFLAHMTLFETNQLAGYMLRKLFLGDNSGV